jgi:hypothetical protein
MGAEKEAANFVRLVGLYAATNAWMACSVTAAAVSIWTVRAAAVALTGSRSS